MFISCKMHTKLKWNIQNRYNILNKHIPVRNCLNFLISFIPNHFMCPNLWAHSLLHFDFGLKSIWDLFLGSCRYYIMVSFATCPSYLFLFIRAIAICDLAHPVQWRRIFSQPNHRMLSIISVKLPDLAFSGNAHCPTLDLFNPT